MIYIAEDILIGEKGDCVRISVVDENNYIHEFEVIRDFCINCYEEKNININRVYELATSRSCFNYNGHKYYL